MFELNKFKIATLFFVLIFVFAIAAMYSNTKDIVNEKNGYTKSEQNYRQEQKSSKDNNINSNEIVKLKNRISDLEQKVSDITDNENDIDRLNCRIQGYMSGDILVPVSESESLREARENDKELVMLCTFQ